MDTIKKQINNKNIKTITSQDMFDKTLTNVCSMKTGEHIGNYHSQGKESLFRSTITGRKVTTAIINAGLNFLLKEANRAAPQKQVSNGMGNLFAL